MRVSYVRRSRDTSHGHTYHVISNDTYKYCAGWVNTHVGFACFETWDDRGNAGAVISISHNSERITFHIDKFLRDKTHAIRSIRRALKEVLPKEHPNE